MSDHLIDRPARLVKCHGCGKHILAAIDGGITIAADLQPADITAEITARLAGKSAYDLISSGTRAYLAYRDVFRVRATRSHPVVADHVCGAVPVYQLIPPRKPVRKKTAVKKTAVRKEEKCPF